MDEEERLKNLRAEYGGLLKTNLETLTEKEDVSSKEIISKVGKDINRGLMGLESFGIGMIYGGFVFPSSMRKIYLNLDDENFKFNTFVKALGGVFGFALNFGLISQLYSCENQKDLGLSYLSLCVLTQVSSGAYEYYRYTKNKLTEEKEKKNKL